MQCQSSAQRVARCERRVSLFSEGGGRWMVADQAVMLCGAVGAVRAPSPPPSARLIPAPLPLLCCTPAPLRAGASYREGLIPKRHPYQLGPAPARAPPNRARRPHLGLGNPSPHTLAQLGGGKGEPVPGAAGGPAPCPQVRGVLSIPLEELEFILLRSGSRAVVAMDEPTLDRLVPVLTAPEAVGGFKFRVQGLG